MWKVCKIAKKDPRSNGAIQQLTFDSSYYFIFYVYYAFIINNTVIIIYMQRHCRKKYYCTGTVQNVMSRIYHHNWCNPASSKAALNISIFI